MTQVHARRSGDRWWAGGAACAAAGIAATPVHVVPRWWTVASALVVVGLGVLAARTPGPVPRRTVLFGAVMFALYALADLLGWPPALTTVLVCVVPLAVLVLVGPRVGTAPPAPWLTAGRRPDRAVAVLAALTVVVAALALVTWALAVRPDVGPYLGPVTGLPLWVALLGVVAFALVNPIWEEALFRGVLLEDLRAAWGPPAGVVGQALLFGAAHWAGLPSGGIGMAMAALWGGALGVIRLRTGGIALPYLVHVAANATIGVLAVLLAT